MSLRGLKAKLEEQGCLTTINKPVSAQLEIARLMHKLEGRGAFFGTVCDSDYPVIAGLCSAREYFALGLGVKKEQLLFHLAEALENPVEPPLLAEAAPCQEVVEAEVDLRRLPILTHLAGDGGPYVTAGVAVIHDPEYGRNVSFHRLMRLDEKRFGVRIVEGRGTDTAFKKESDKIAMAVCIGNSIPVLLAAAMSPEKGVDELAIANALLPTPLVKCRTIGLHVPADSEIILEGYLKHEEVDEGPFLDLTETPDIVRRQPVFEVQCITHRREAIYQALLPGGLEHKLLMGVPREPTIWAEVNQVCECLNVLITPGGASWLHAIVQIRKHHADDGGKAIRAAFRGHGSLKHVVVVDEDVNIYDLNEVEWAIATRFQADQGLMTLSDQPGSSLDPSALHAPKRKSRTSKMGLDATIPWYSPTGGLRSEREREAFLKMRYDDINLANYVQPLAKDEA
jgi:UbiD family decarboxylase